MSDTKKQLEGIRDGLKVELDQIDADLVTVTADAETKIKAKNDLEKERWSTANLIEKIDALIAVLPGEEVPD